MGTAEGGLLEASWGFYSSSSESLQVCSQSHKYLFVVKVIVLYVCDHGTASLMGPPLPLLRLINFWAGVDPVQLLENSANMLNNLVRPSWPIFMDIYGRSHPGALRMVLWDLKLFQARKNWLPITLRLVPYLPASAYLLSWAHFWGLMRSLGAPGK